MGDVMTPETHPGHPVIGRIFQGGYPWGFWFCESYDPRIGFWMARVGDPSERHNVSERAIGATFHEVWDGVSLIPRRTLKETQERSNDG